MKKIILTGGGTAGHVTPNLALLPSLKKAVPAFLTTAFPQASCADTLI